MSGVKVPLGRRTAMAAFGLMGGAVLALALVPGFGLNFQLGGTMNHYMAFAALAAASSMLWPGMSSVLLLIGLSFFGGAIEVLQGWMALGRDAQWQDWLDDTIAATATLALIGLGRLMPFLWPIRAAHAARSWVAALIPRGESSQSA